MKYYFLSTLFLLGCYLAGAQDTTTVDSSVIEVLFIKHYKQKEEADGVWKYMDEDVHLRQGAVDMWFDKGLIRPIKQVEAYGSVRIQQDDTINIYSDSLWYDGLRETAVLRSNVVLEDPRMRMETAEMDYDTRTKIARFPAAKIISDSAVLVSKQGYYDVGSQMMHFMDSVRIDHPKYNFKADTLRYNTERDIAYFDGPTTFYNKDKVVYCEDGFFDTKGDYAELKEKAYYYSTAEGKKEQANGDQIIYDGKADMYYLIGNAHYENEERSVDADTIMLDGATDAYSFKGNAVFNSLDSTKQQSIRSKQSDYNAETKTMLFREEVVIEADGAVLLADSLDYNTETQDGWARGDVSWADTSSGTVLTCGEAFYNDSSSYLLAHKNPVMQSLVEGDSMWIRADTIISFKDTTQMEYRHLKAYHSVRIFKSDLQVVCDSLYFDDKDSMFHFYQSPILWADGTQFTADTMLVLLKNERLNKIKLLQEAMIVRTDDSLYFSQIKGQYLTAYFDTIGLEKVNVDEAGEMVYYGQDASGAYLGVNDLDCRRMRMFFTNQKVQKILYLDQPKGIYYPMGQVNHSNLRLEGFDWLERMRPKNKWAILKNSVKLKTGEYGMD